jgi:hypothetical protein
LQRAQVDITNEYVYALGGGRDHRVVFAVEVTVGDVNDAFCIAFKSATAAFQFRPLSNVEMIVEHVTTSGDILLA